MTTRLWLGTAGLASVVLGCSWSHSVLAQGSILLPPPVVTAQPPGPSAPRPATAVQPPVIQQAAGVAPRGVVKSRVVARINGVPILEEEVVATALPLIQERKRHIPEQFWGQLEKEAYQRILDDMITDEAIIQDAAIKVPPPVLKRYQEVMNKEFEKLLKQDRAVAQLPSKDAEKIKDIFERRGQSVDLMRRQFIRHNLALAWVRESSRNLIDEATTREKLLDYYRANPAEFAKPERVVWQHIFVDVDRYDSRAAARQVAETVWQLLRNTRTEEEFNTLVEKYADVDSKVRRGAGQGSLRGEIRPKELEKHIFEQPAGGQGPVVETSRGYHVFRVVEHTPHEIVTFEKACSGLRRKLEDKVTEAEFTRMGKEARAKTVLEMIEN